MTGLLQRWLNRRATPTFTDRELEAITAYALASVRYHAVTHRIDATDRQVIDAKVAVIDTDAHMWIIARDQKHYLLMRREAMRRHPLLKAVGEALRSEAA